MDRTADIAVSVSNINRLASSIADTIVDIRRGSDSLLIRDRAEQVKADALALLNHANLLVEYANDNLIGE